jgi:hypothetical protein
MTDKQLTENYVKGSNYYVTQKLFKTLPNMIYTNSKTTGQSTQSTKFETLTFQIKELLL